MFNDMLINIYSNCNKSLMFGCIYLVCATVILLLFSQIMMVSRGVVVRTASLLPLVCSFILCIQIATILLTSSIFKIPAMFNSTRLAMQTETNMFFKASVTGHADKAVEKMLKDYSRSTGIDFIGVSNKAGKTVNKVITSYNLH